MATPALRALRRKFEGAKISFVGKDACMEVLAGGNLADDFLPDVSKRRPRLIHFFRMRRRLRAGRYDLAVLLPNSFRTAALAYSAGIDRIAGYARDGRGWMLSDKLSPARDEAGKFIPAPMIDYYLNLMRLLGAEADSRRMKLAVTPAEDAEAARFFDEADIDPARPLVMLNPGASFGPSKLWPPERYAAVADALIDRRGAQIIINASPSDRPVATRVAAAMRRSPSVNFADRDNTLGLLKALLRRSSLLITNDTGARHIAAAFGVAVVTLFGSTDPRWSEIGCESERIVCTNVSCSPCQKKRCPLPAGPMHHRCMTAITVEMVLAAAKELLDASGHD